MGHDDQVAREIAAANEGAEENEMMNFDLGMPVATAALEEPPPVQVYHQHHTMGCKQEESPKKPQVTRMTA